jgi:hypothetical protein
MKRCPKCNQIKPLDNFWKDKNQPDGLNTYCTPCKKQRMDDYYSNPTNLANHRKTTRKWMDNNPDAKKVYRKNYTQKKRSTPEGRLKATLSSYLCTSLKRSLEYGFGKNTLDILGVANWGEFKSYIESQWVEGMSWDNWGIGKDNLTWHIDHIKPVSSANTLDEIKQLFHYSNLRPMWGSDNIRKRNSILD